MTTLTCPMCNEPLLPTDPDNHCGIGDGKVVHGACLIRSIAGGVAHQDKRCSCFGGTDPHRAEGMSDREDALAAWKFFIEVTSFNIE